MYVCAHMYVCSNALGEHTFNASFVTFPQKHHYRELSQEAQQSLGEIPNKFIDYWTQRFPLLLLHTWITMQCVKNEPIFSQYYHKDYIFSQSLYVNGSKDACSAYSSVTLADNKLNAVQQWIKMKPEPDTAKRDKTQIPNDISEQQYFKQNNFKARKDSEMSPNIRRRNDRGGNRKESSPKRFRNTRRDSYALKSENWRAEDDPTRHLYQKIDLARARDNVNITDQPRHLHNTQYSRDSPENLVLWRDVGRQTDTRKTLEITGTYDTPDFIHRPELKRTDCSDLKPSEIFQTENSLPVAVDYEKQALPSFRQQYKQLKNDDRNQTVKKRHRHKSAEATAVWTLPKSLPPTSD